MADVPALPALPKRASIAVDGVLLKSVLRERRTRLEAAIGTLRPLNGLFAPRLKFDSARMLGYGKRPGVELDFDQEQQATPAPRRAGGEPVRPLDDEAQVARDFALLKGWRRHQTGLDLSEGHATQAATLVAHAPLGQTPFEPLDGQDDAEIAFSVLCACLRPRPYSELTAFAREMAQRPLDAGASDFLLQASQSAIAAQYTSLANAVTRAAFVLGDRAVLRASLARGTAKVDDELFTLLDLYAEPLRLTGVVPTEIQVADIEAGQEHVLIVALGTVSTAEIRGWTTLAESGVVLSRGSFKSDFEIETIRRKIGIHEGFVFQDIFSEKLAPYSADEEELSALCNHIVQKILGEISSMSTRNNTEISYINDLMDSLRYRIDDYIFNPSRTVFSIYKTIKDQKFDRIIIINDNIAEFSIISTMLSEMGRLDTLFSGPVHFPLDPETFYELHYDQPEKEEIEVPSTELGVRISTRFGNGSKAGQRAANQSSATGAAPIVVVGRPMDRNYISDTRDLSEAFLSQHSCIFVPTELAAERGATVDATLARLPQLYPPQVRIVGDAYRAFRAPPGRGGQRYTGLWSVLKDRILRERDGNPVVKAMLNSADAGLRRFFDRNFGGFIEACGVVAGFVEAIRPHLIVVAPGRDWIARMAVLAGNRVGAPSFDLQTVFVGPRSRYKPPLATYQTSIESHSSSVFQSYFGVEPSRIIQTGCSKIGAMRREAQNTDIDALRQRFGLMDRAETIVVFATSAHLAPCLKVVTSLIRALEAAQAAGLGRLRLIVKPHPTLGEHELAVYRSLVGSAPVPSLFLHGISIAPVIALADIVVTRFSNVGLEAALLEKDVIAARFSDEPLPIPLDKMGVAELTTSPEDLGHVLNDFLKGGPRRASYRGRRQAYFDANAQLLVDDVPEFMSRAILEKARSARQE